MDASITARDVEILRWQTPYFKSTRDALDHILASDSVISKSDGKTILVPPIGKCAATTYTVVRNEAEEVTYIEEPSGTKTVGLERFQNKFKNVVRAQ